MNTRDKIRKLDPESLAKVDELLTTGKVPAIDREAFEAWRKAKSFCVYCGKELPPQPKRSRRRYCDNSCKQADYRRRKAGK